MPSKKAQKPSAVAPQIELNWDAFARLLNIGDATKQTVWAGKSNGNPTTAIFQRELTINGKVLPASKLRGGTSGARVYDRDPDQVARVLLSEGHLDRQAVTSLGIAQMVAVYLGFKDTMSREYVLADAVLGAIAEYNGYKNVGEMITQPTAKARKQSGMTDAEIELIFA